jgi:hypothetical protein
MMRCHEQMKLAFAVKSWKGLEIKTVKFLRQFFSQDESSVQSLIDQCIQDEDKLYLCVSSPTIKDKPVQIRPWRLSDADFVLDASLPLDPRKTVFVGGVPRPLKAGTTSRQKLKANRIIFGLFFCKFFYLRLKTILYCRTYPLIYSYPWSFDLQIYHLRYILFHIISVLISRI